jgi:hypothetical protein
LRNLQDFREGRYRQRHLVKLWLSTRLIAASRPVSQRTLLSTRTQYQHKARECRTKIENSGKGLCPL